MFESALCANLVILICSYIFLNLSVFLEMPQTLKAVQISRCMNVKKLTINKTFLVHNESHVNCRLKFVSSFIRFDHQIRSSSWLYYIITQQRALQLQLWQQWPQLKLASLQQLVESASGVVSSVLRAVQGFFDSASLQNWKRFFKDLISIKLALLLLHLPCCDVTVI